MEREVKSKGASLASNLTLGGMLTALVMYLLPNIPEEFRVYVPVFIVGVLGWLGSTARDFVAEYEADGNELHWLGRSFVRLLG